MRILFDPVYSTYPRKCSSAFKFKLMAERLLATYDDAQIIWRIPEWSKDEDKEWLPNDPRILPVIAPHARTNRIAEYTQIRDDLADQLAAYGGGAFTDLVVTMRTGVASQMRMQMACARSRWKDRRLVVMEEMAILTDRAHIGGVKHPLQDLTTISGYMASDATLITAGHVRDKIVQASKRFFSPSTVMDLRQKLKLVSPIDLFEFKTKPPHKGGPLKMLYTGRMNMSTSNTEVSFKAMESAFIMAGEETPDLTISTQSAAAKADYPEWGDLQHNDREAFWELLEHGSDIAVYTTVDAEFSLTLIEPLCFGVPVMVIRKPWSEALIGKDYPFFVKGATEAYAFIKMFQDDYDGMYAKFIEWRDGEFKQRFEKGGVYERRLVDVVMDQAAELQGLVEDPGIQQFRMSFAETLAEQVPEGEPFTMFDLLTKAYKAGKLDNHLSEKKWRSDAIPSALKADLHNNRILVKHLTGAKDHGFEGAMIK